jgi:pimeloyl-ACP methyl ester carboxylesterase
MLRRHGARGAKRAIGCALAMLLASAVCAPAAAQGGLQRAAVNGGQIDYEVTGSGEPVLMIHGSGVAATFAPQMSEPALSGYRLIRMHRRGFAGSSRTPVPFTMKDHAADARALLRTLGVERAHIVGHSFGGSVAMQLALDAPELVHSLVVMEAPIFDAAAPPASFERLSETYRAGDKEGAMSTFSQMSYGPEWRTLASRVPGGPDQVMRDADTVFTTEVPAMVYWGFGKEQAARITQPIVYVTGGAGRGASLTQLQEWIPRLESVVVPNVTHAMLMQDPPAVAAAIAAFLKRHPL